MPRRALVFVLAGILAGCAALRTDPYAVRVSDMGYLVKYDDAYRVIPLRSPEDQAWFEAQTRALLERRKTRAAFLDEGRARYPGFDDSWRKLADVFSP